MKKASRLYIIEPTHTGFLCPSEEVNVKDFFNRYSYSIIKMFVNQFAISVFGSVLAMATASSGNDKLTLVVSIFAILFYLFLIYTMTWEVGAKDKISVDVGKKAYKPHTGLMLSLIANIPNFVIAGVYTVAYPAMERAEWAGNTAAVARVGSIVIEGMYLGTISTLKIGETYLNRLWWTYFLITVPALFVSWLAYFLGHRNFRFFAGLKPQKSDNK